MTVLLFDADIYKYSCSSTVEHLDKESGVYMIEPVDMVYFNINNKIKAVLEALHHTSYEVYVTKLHDKTNFRSSIYPLYKQNRTDKRKPYYLQDAHEYLKTAWNATEVEGQEADDAIAIRHVDLLRRGHDSIIVSIDKDFNTVPGKHYNPVKKDLYNVSKLEALKFFYLQILTGDVADNVPRIKKGWRQKSAEALINKALNEKELLTIVLKEAIIQYTSKDKKALYEAVLQATGCKITNMETYIQESARKDIELRARLLRLRHTENEMYDLPFELLEAV
jgi:5'-3' exonuclease